MSIADEVSNLSDEDQQCYHAYTQKRMRKRWADARNRTEREQDEKDKRRPQ